jgi:DNA helicase-2/ATP-dependent DNA helicase PcrA
MPFRDELNPQQREAVETTEGPVLILAGAGSGKTRVITYRIAHLVENVGVPGDHILAVTFTNKAASEMAERVEKMIGHRSLHKPIISTFHSLCVRLLRRDIEKLQINGKGLTKQFVIYDEADQQQLVKGILKRVGIDDKQLKPSVVLGRISHAKNHMLDPQEMYLQSADPLNEKVAQIWEVYRKELAKANAMDFDDLLLESVRLLKVVPQVREYYQRRFEHMLVDEYQDTNRPQYELMRLLSNDRHNVCAVGDEDQSIYSWRGADIRNILEFERDFPNAKIVRLEQNYRSTQNILQGASAVVANNIKRKGKNLWTARQGGSKIGFYEAPDGENEALFAADYIYKYLQKQAEEGTDARAAVLYRVNSQSRLCEEAMRRYGMKYHVVGGFSFYERAEIKDMISYLKVIHNPDDSIAVQRVINTPTRGIGKSTMEVLERVALETGLSIWGAIKEATDRQLLPGRSCQALGSFVEIIEDARAMLDGTYADRLSTAVAAPLAKKNGAPANIAPSDSDVSFEFGTNHSFDFGPPAEEDVAFNFGSASQQETPTTEARRHGEEAEENATTRAQSHREDDESETEQEANVDFSFGGDNRDVAPAASRRAADDNNVAPLAQTDTGPISETSDISETTPSQRASTAEVLKFLLDRTGYIKQLEAENTPEADSRIENLRELVNAAMDSADRGETLDQFLDHAALVSDADQYDERAQITLMTLHAAKGLEFPLVFLIGLEEGLFPHSRTFNDPDGLEEERRLCYVGMTRAMDTLVISRARYRRRYGTDMPEATVASRFLEEIPEELVEDLGSPRRTPSVMAGYYEARERLRERGYNENGGYEEDSSRHYDYENEDQRPQYSRPGQRSASASRPGSNNYSGKTYNSIDNIAEFFASRGKKFTRPKMDVEPPTGHVGFKPGMRVRHPKYGEGTVYKREGDGENAKISVHFTRHGLKKLVEKYAQLEKA